MPTEISVRDARAKLAELIGRAEDHHEEFVLTVHGKPAAVLLSVYDWESITETLALLNDREALADVDQARAEVEQGLDTPLVDHETSQTTAA